MVKTIKLKVQYRQIPNKKQSFLREKKKKVQIVNYETSPKSEKSRTVLLCSYVHVDQGKLPILATWTATFSVKRPKKKKIPLFFLPLKKKIK